MNRDLTLFMPGFAKPLNEWSARALQSAYTDLMQQRDSAREGPERKAVDARLKILFAEATRRSTGLDPAQVAQLKQQGADRSSLDRSAADKDKDEQLRLPLNEREATRGRGPDYDRQIGKVKAATALLSPDRTDQADRGGEGRGRER